MSRYLDELAYLAKSVKNQNPDFVASDYVFVCAPVTKKLIDSEATIFAGADHGPLDSVDEIPFRIDEWCPPGRIYLMSNRDM